MENPEPNRPLSESRYVVMEFVIDVCDVVLDERVRRVVKLALSEEPDRSDLG
jgi:hypothetical protein